MIDKGHQTGLELQEKAHEFDVIGNSAAVGEIARQHQLIMDPVQLPLKGKDAEAYMREAERNVLDLHHSSTLFWQLEPANALLALLEAFDSFAVTQQLIAEHRSSLGVWQHMKSYQDGFVHAVRWVYPRCTKCKAPTRVSGKEIDQAGHFLNYMVNYAVVAAFHVGFGKGLYYVEADDKSRVVRFQQTRQPDTRSHQYFGEAVRVREKAIKDSNIDDVLSSVDVAAARREVLLDEGRIAPLSASGMVCDRVCQFHVGALRREITRLPSEANIGECSYEQFERYWITLSAWSSCALRAYLYLANQDVPQDECMATQVLRQTEFIRRMSDLSGLEPAVVQRITRRLTYGLDTTRPDPYLQPLFTMDDRLMWSPLVVSMSRQPRNLLKLLCQTKATAQHGATLNGNRERGILRRFGEFLQNSAGYAFKLNVPLRHGTSESELDMLAFRAQVDSEVLLVQAKAVIATDDLHDVDTVSKDLNVGAEQCRRAEALLKAMPLEQRRRLFPFVPWDRVTTYCPLVLTPDSEPGARYDSNEVPAIALTTIEHTLRGRDLKSPSRICFACKERPWLDDRKNEILGYFRIRIGDVDYEIPMGVTPEDAASIRAETMIPTEAA